MTKIQLDRIDHYVYAAPDLKAPYAALTSLGITASEPVSATDSNSLSCAFMVGGIAIEHLGVRDREVPAANAGEAHLFERVDVGGGPYFIIFPVASLEGAREVFAHDGFTEIALQVFDDAAITLLRPNGSGAGCTIQIAEYPPAMAAMQAQFASIAQHDFPIERVDHLAILPSDFDASTQYWIDVLGVPMQDELTGPDFMARRFKVGDLVVELVRPVGDSSPRSTLPIGLLPMVAFEVGDVEAAVAFGRERGFTVSDPAPGSVEGTVVASIPSTELAGVTFSLVQYV